MSAKKARRGAKDPIAACAAKDLDFQLKDLPLTAAAIRGMETLQDFQDCLLVLDDRSVPCHKLKLAEVSAVMR